MSNSVSALPARLRTIAGGLVAAVLLAACGSGTPAGTSSTPASSAQTPAASAPSSSAQTAGTAISTAQNATLGKILVNSQGMTLYVFTKDAAGQGISNCTGSCAALWPPLLTTGTPTPAAGVTGALGTITRSGGTKQVTINGQPLYTYSKDAQPGQANGQGFGGLWFAVGPSGQRITAGTTSGDTVNVANNPKLGQILVNSAGMTLYLFTKDAPGVSTCTGTCAKLWPPLAPPAAGTPTAGPGVTAKLSVITRSDGTKQVAINGQPLYTYSADTKAGDTAGEGYGNFWFAVKPAGAEVGVPAASSSAAATATAGGY